MKACGSMDSLMGKENLFIRINRFILGNGKMGSQKDLENTIKLMELY